MYLNLLIPISVVQSKVQVETTNFSRLISNMYNTNIVFHYHKHNFEKQKVLGNTGFKRMFVQKRQVETEGWN